MANIAIYKFNSGTETLPVFDSGYEYTYTDESNGDGTITRTIVSDTAPSNIRFDSLSGLIEVNYINTTNIRSLSYLFNNCANLTHVDLYNIDTVNVTDMSYMFAGCSSLTTLDLSAINTSNVLNMNSMFMGCSGIFSLDIKSLSTSKVTGMNGMFQDCTSLSSVDMSGMNISSLTNMGHMFNGCTNLLSVKFNGLDLNNNMNLTSIFEGCLVLNNVSMDNCSIEDINNMINALPTKSANENQAKLKVNNVDISGINSSTLEAKNWNLASYEIVLRYKFDRGAYANVIPTFDSEFTNYVVIDEAIVGNIVTRAIGHENLKPKRVYFGSDYLEMATIVPKCNALKEVLYLDTSSLNDVRGMFRYCRYLESIDVTGWVTSKVSSLWDMFAMCTRLKTVTGLETWDTSNVISMNAMFHYCENLTSINVSNFSTDNVTDVAYMFANCRILPSLDLSNWNMTNVNTIYVMFDNCYNLASIGNVANWNTGNVLNMSYTFSNCRSLPSLDLSNWDTSKVTTMQGMFKDCYSLQSINVSNWDTSRVTNMDHMFGVNNEVVYQKRMILTEITGLANFDTGRVTNMSAMFQCCERINTALKGIEGWEVGNVTNMGLMFHRCGALTSLDLSRWNVGKVSNMDRMFRDCYVLKTLNTSNWVTSSLGYAGEMFYYCQLLESIDVGTWVMNKTTSTQGMFFHCDKLQTINGIENWNTPVLQRIDSMFNGCVNLKSINLSSWTTNNVTSMWSLFAGATNIQSINLSNWNLSKVTSLSSVFSGCKKLSELNISGWNTGNITSMYGMFYDCNSLTSLDVSGFDTSKVTDMEGMFENCSSLTSLDVSGFDTSKVTNMKSMFDDCKLLTTIDVSNFIMDKVYTISGMFYDCENVLSLDVSNWNTASLLHMNSVFAGCTMLSSIDLSRWNTSKVEAIGDLLDDCISLKTININNLNINRDNISTVDITTNVLPDKMFINDINTLKLLIETNDVRDRSGLEAGILVTPIKDIDKNTLQVLEERNWSVRNLVAQYTFDAMTDENTIPVFNDEFNENEYEIVDTVTEDQININDFIWEDGYIDGSNGNNIDGDIAQTRTQQFILISPNTTYEINDDLIRSTRLHFDWYDESKKYIGQNYIEATANKIVSPVNARYLRLWYLKEAIVGDIVLSSKIVNRTIETVNGLLPTMIRFGYRSDADAQVDYPAHGVYSRSSSLLEISSLDTSNITTFVDMFRKCERLYYVNTDGWVANKANYADCMFQGCASLQEVDLSNFITTSITSMHGMFADCFAAKSINVTGWDLSNVKSISYLFCNCASMTELIGFENWNTSNIEDFHWLFYFCSSISQLDLSKWNTSKVTDCHQMFSYCQLLTSLDVSTWDTSKVNNATQMFLDCYSLTSLNLSTWKTGSLKYTNQMFNNCYSLTTIGDVSNWDVSKIVNADLMFESCRSLKSLNVGTWDVSNWASLYALFHNCHSLTSLGNIGDWNTSNINNIYGVFFACRSLTSLDLSKWDTSNVTTMHALFGGCSALTSVGDISHWNTSKVTTMSAVFWSTPKLEKVDVRGWDISSVTDISGFIREFNDQNPIKHTLDITNFKLKSDVVISEFTSNTLQYVKCNDSDTINILANYLPARNGLEAGILITDDKTGINLTALTDKNWNVITIDESISLAEYKFDNRVCDYVPTFNDGFKGYFLIDSTNSEDVVIENYIPYDHQPEFSSSTGELVPYPTGTHTVPAANVITRKIICINLPNLIRFGAEGNGVTGNTLTAPRALLEVNSVNFTGITDKASDMFRMCTNVKSINIDSRLYATDIHDFFAECRNLENITGLNNIDLGNCVHNHYAFVKCDKLKNIDVSSWDVSHVYSIAGMFAYCVSLETVNLTGWQTDNVQVSDLMFVGCVNLTTITGIEYLNMTKVINISEMFRYCHSLTSLDLSRWNVSAVTNMAGTFCLCTHLTTIGDVSNWNVSSVTTMDYLFERCFNLGYINVTNWNTINLRTMAMIFFQCNNLQDVDMSNWKTGNVGSIHGAFTGCKKFTTMDLHKWDVSNVTDFHAVFSDCTALTSLNLSGWNTSKVTKMSIMFDGTSNLTEVAGIENWDVRNVRTMEKMFAYSGITNLDLKNWKTSSKLTNMFAMFMGSKAQLIDVSNFNTSNVTSFYALFNECYALSTLRGIENFNTSNVTDMRWMFAESWRLTSLDVSKWNVEKVDTFATMFYNTGIREIDVSNWNTASLRGGGLRNTFGHCTLLEHLDISNWRADDVTDATKLLFRHVSLKTLNINNIKLPELHDDLATDMKSLEKLYVNIVETLEALLPYMPDRTGKESGKIVTSLGEKIPDNVIETLNSKNWNIVPIIVHYKYDPEEHEDLLPIFNNEFNASEYNVIDNERVYTIDNVLWESGSLDASGTEYDNANYPNAARSAFISVVPSTTIEFNIDYCNVYWYDSNRVILDNCGHIFGTNEGLENGNKCRVPGAAKFVRICRSVGPNADVQLRYRIKDRLIESVNNNAPYIIRFGSENWEVRYTQQTALLEVTECNMINTTTAYRLFGCCTYLKHAVISNITDKCQSLAQLCHGCSFISEIRGLKDFDTRNVFTLSALVQSASRLQLKGDEFVNWNTEKVTNMDQMFYDCHTITTLDLSKWDTRNVTHMHHMFYRSVALTDLNITGWDVGNVQVMNHMFYECSKLTSINTTNWNTSNVKDMSYMFTFCEKLTSIDVSNWNTGNVTNMDQMFAKCRSITTLAVDNWDTSKVTKFYNMFAYCSELQTLNLSKWQTGNVWTMNGMFIWSNKLTTIGDISKWDVRKVEDMGWMFERAESLSAVNVSGWQTEKLDRCNSMFAFTNMENITLRSFNTNLLRNINNMFTGANMKSLDISNFNLDNVPNSNISNMLTSAKQMKYIKCNNINTVNRIATQLPTRTVDNPGYLICKGDVSQINRSILRDKNWNVVSADQLNVVARYKYDRSIYVDLVPVFNYGYYGFIEDESIEGNIVTRVIEHIDGVLPTEMTFGVYENPGEREKSLIEILELVTSNLTTMKAMFCYCENVTAINTTNWDTSNVIDMCSLFYGCHKLQTLDVSSFNTSNVINMAYLFSGNSYLEKASLLSSITGLENWDTRNVKYMDNMFYRLPLITSLDVSNFNTSKVTNMLNMFTYCYKLASLDVSNWDTSNVIFMNWLFYGCRSLQSIDVSNWDTSKVTTMSSMFCDCISLESIDVSKWDTSNVEQMQYMFGTYYTTEMAFTELNISNFNTSKVTDMSGMFKGCNKLTSLDLSNFDTSKVTRMYEMFRDCEKLTSLDLSHFDTRNVDALEYIFANCNALQTLDVSTWDTSNVSSMGYIFANCHALENLDLSNWDLGKAWTTQYMFSECRSLKYLDVSKWDVSNATRLSCMFWDCRSLANLDVSNWNTSKVENVYSLFCNCLSMDKIDISTWDTSNVTRIEYLFSGYNYDDEYIDGEPTNIMTLKQLNINNLNISDAVDQYNFMLFANNLEKVYTNKLDVLEFIIQYLPNRLGLEPGKIVTSIRNEIPTETITELTSYNWEIVDIVAQYKFDANVYENLIPAFNVEFIEDKYTVIDDISEIVIDEFDWEAGIINTANGNEQAASTEFPKAQRSRFLNIIPNVKYKFNVNYAHTYWFDENKNFISYTGMIGNDTDTSENVSDRYIIPPENAKYLRIHRGAGVTEMTITAKTINRTIESVNGDLPTMMRFGKVNAPNEPANNSLLAVLDANMSNITDMCNMFDHCNRLTKINTANWDVSNVTDMEAAFAQCGSLTTLDVSNWDISNVTNLYAMFQSCKKLTSLDLSKWNTSNVISTSHLFYNCNNLTTIGDIGDWDTSKVTNMRFMFAECHKLSTINVSNFNTSKVFSMKQMFYKCLAITELNVSNFDTSNVTDMNTMFHDCNNLTRIDVSGWDTSNVTDMYAMFHSTGLKTINLSNFDFSKVISAESLIGTAGMYTNINNNLTNVQLPDSDLPDGSVISNFIANRSQLKYIKCNSKNNIVKLVNSLPTRTAADPGKILTNIPLTEFSDIVVETLTGKNWAIVDVNSETKVIAKYKFDKNLYSSLIPIIERGTIVDDIFVDDEYLDTVDMDNMYGKDGKLGYTVSASNIVTRTIRIMKDDALPSLLRFNAFKVNWDTTDIQPCDLVSMSLLEVIELAPIKNLILLCYKCFNVKYINISNHTGVEVLSLEYAFAHCRKLEYILGIADINTTKVIDMNHAFWNCNSLTTLDVSKWDTSSAVKMNVMFYGCKTLTSLDVSNFDTSNVTNISEMFHNCESLTSLDVSKWDTSKVTNMGYLFAYCMSVPLLDVSKWDTSKVTSMGYMFCGCCKLNSLDLSNFDTSNVTDMCNMFRQLNLTSIDVSNFNTSKVTTMYGMFRDNNKLQVIHGLENFDTSNVTSMYTMFYCCPSLTSLDLSNFNTSKVANIADFVSANTGLQFLDMSNFDTSNVINMNYLFNGIHADAININNVYIKKDVLGLFFNAGPKKIYLNRVDTLDNIVSQLPDRSSTTTGRIIMPNKDQVSAETVALLAGKNWHLGNLIASYKYDSNICEDLIPMFDDRIFGTDKYVVVDTNDSHGVITRNIEDVDGTMPIWLRFQGNDSLLELLDMNTDNIIYMNNMFLWCHNLTYVNTTHFNTSKVVDMRRMFESCYALTSLDVSNFDTSNVTNMDNMFHTCYSLTSLDVSNFNTSKVTSMDFMFYNCDMLTSLDVSNFDTSKVTFMRGMFHSCNNLTSLDVSNFDTSKVTNMDIMFGSDWAKGSKLQSLDISNFNMENVTTNIGMFNKCQHLNKVIVNDLSTASKIIPYLPNKNEYDHVAGTLVYYDIDPALLDTPTLQAKNWNLSYEPIAAKYIFDSNMHANFIPYFGGGFTSVYYKVIDDVKTDGRVVRTIKYLSNKRPTSIIFGDSSGSYATTGTQSLLSIEYVDVKDYITSASNMFANNLNVKKINTRNWDTSHIVTMYCMFYSCKKLTSIDVSHFNTDNVENMVYMFFRNYDLTSIDVNNFNTSNVTNMGGMFYQCEKLTSLNLSNWDTNNVTNMGEFFAGCANLSSLNISNFVINESTNIDYLFGGIYNLEKIDARFCSTDTINKLISKLPNKSDGKYGKIYIINNNEHELINKNDLDNKNWKAVIRGGNIKAVHIPNELFQSLGLGNVMVKHVHIGERFL